MLQLRRLVLLTGLAVLVVGGGSALGATPKPGDFFGQAAAPYNFGVKRDKQDIHFTASANKRVLVMLVFMRCTTEPIAGTDVTFNLSAGRKTMRAKVSKSGKISGTGKATRGNATATQTISGKFISATRAEGSIKVTYAGTSAAPALRCVTGGRWSAKSAKRVPKG